MGEAELLYAKTLEESGREKEAANFLLENFEKGNSGEFQLEKKKFLSSMLDDKFSVEEVEALLGKKNDIALTPFLLSSLVKKNLVAGNVEEAKHVFAKLQKDFPDNSETMKSERLFNQPTATMSGDAPHIIVCLLPITNVLGAANTAAEDVLEGIKNALHEYNSLAGNRFALLIKNTKRDSSQIVSLVKEIESGDNYSAVIGPLFSDETRFFLEVSKQLSLPLISPTATDENLQSGNKLFYQANTSMELHGKVMAQYLYYVENKRSLAALFPGSGNATVIGKSFVSEFKYLGGKVLEQTYSSKKLITESFTVDFKKSLKGMEGIFLPLNDNSFIPVILSAMLKNEIDLPIYGNQDWFTTKGLETSSALSEKLTFTSDSFIDYQDEDVATFSRKYLETTGREVNLNNLYGYDAAK
ncbi:MAG: ABC transporter substrate-binding protein, partial [Ignavibacteria bacterium]|nr:ABC transporter substrate-binding protein [Ignavibacteria bacterium]